MHAHRRLFARAARSVSVFITVTVAAALLPVTLAAGAAAEPTSPGAKAPAFVLPTGSTDADFPVNSLIVDMGVSPQTVANGLKPYGFVYELLTTHKVPVAWAVKNSKSTMGETDFTLTNVVDTGTNATIPSKTFAGSSFIISGDFVSDIPAARLTYWRGLGVKIYRATTPLTNLPQFSLLQSWPKIVLDADSSSQANGYYTNAGIPATAYREALPNSGTASQPALNNCDDLFVFPHADPTWAKHSNLKNFNNSGGYIFAQCHAPSVLENIDDPGDVGTAPDLNFLSVDGLVPYGSHSDGTLPYSYNTDWSDPVMQVMNTIDAATTNGSEQIYLPKAGGWRPGAKVLVWDPDHPQLNGGPGTDLSPGKAAVSVYGRGFDNPNNGMVMYQASHEFDKSNGTANVAAQRAFLNFNLLAGIDRAIEVTSNVPTTPITPGTTIPVSTTATGGAGPGSYSYKWTSGCGGTFANDTAASTTFTAPTVTSSTACTIRVTVTDTCGRVAFDATSVTVNPPPPPMPSISLEKSVADSNDTDTIGSLGETLTYTFAVTNTGNVPLTNVTITDAKLSMSAVLCAANLAVGETKTCTKTYVVTKPDIVAGSVDNTATASGSPPTGSPVTDTDSATMSTPAVPGLSITKTVVDSNDPDSLASEGETLTYSFTVTNTGNVDLAPVTITDPKLGLNDVTCVAALDVGQTKPCTSTYTYVVSGTGPGGDITAGVVTNQVTAKGTKPGGGFVTAQGSSSITTFPSTSALVLEKTVADSNDADATAGLGETLTYTFTVSNAGNVALAPVTITDNMFTPSTFECAASLASGATTTCTRTHVVTQADILNGSVDNSATATGTPPSGPPVTSTDTATIPAPAAPSMTMTKAVADSNDADDLGSYGEVLTYSFTVTNTGNVTLAPVTLNDPKLGLSNVQCVASLAPGATTTCPDLTQAQRSYTVGAGDTAAGSVTNTVTGTGTPPPGGGQPVQAQASTTIQTPGYPSLSLVKSVADSNDADSIASQGEILTYTFTVTNTGSVTLAPVEITDGKLGLSGADCVTSLAVGETKTCTYPYTVTAADVSSGSVHNTATATGKPPTGPDVTGQGSATIPTAQPAMSMTKSVADSNPVDGIGTEGETLTYTFTVTNTGNVPLSNVTITDPMIPALAGGALCVANLPVGQTTNCPSVPAATHVVSAQDVEDEVVTNTATGSAQPPSGPPVGAQATAWIPTVDDVAPAALSIKKVVDVSQAAPGDTVTYTLTVKNAGPGPAANVVVTDNLPSGTTFVSASAPCTQSGGTVSCSLDTVFAGETKIITIKVKVAPIAGGDTSHQHQLDYTKVESHLSLFDGDTTSATATCPTGYFATDGSVRLDHVDQGTGTFEDAVVLASGVTPDGKSWTGKVRNDATGQVQAKVNVVCMTVKTTSGEDHSHDVVVTGPVSSSETFASGRHDVDLTCGTGYHAITPSFTFTSGQGVVSTRRLAGGGWRFIVDVDDTAQGTFSVQCLSTSLATAQGHSHDLGFTELTDTVTVPAGQVKEVQLTCPDGYKGIVAWADMDPGLVSLGNDPQPITRVFKFFNPTGGPLSADYGLLCVRIRTNGGSGDASITNTASVSTSSSDPNTADNHDSATFSVSTTGVVVTPKVSVLSQAGKTLVALKVKAAGKRAVTFKLFATRKVKGTKIRSGSLLAQKGTKLRNGQATVRMLAKSFAVKALKRGKVRSAKLVITTRDGRKDVRVVKIRG